MFHLCEQISGASSSFRGEDQGCGREFPLIIILEIVVSDQNGQKPEIFA